GSDGATVKLTRKKGSPVHHRKHTMASSRSPRSSKHHHSRSRSRSRDRKRKRDRKCRRSRSRSKEARKRDSQKPTKSNRRTDEYEDAERLSTEHGEERSRRKNGRSSKGRSLSRSHSRERQHHSRSKDKRRSRSRDKKKKARSRSGSRTKHRHHSRSRSKSSFVSRDRKKRIEKIHRRSHSVSTSPPAFRGRNTAMDAQEALARRLERAKKLQEQKEKELLEKQQLQQQEIAAAAAAAAAVASNPGLNVAALLASGTQVTPQIAVAAQMAALQAKTLAETGIAVPSYYNPSSVNPMKFAEQEKKRKKLWQGKKDGDKSQTAELWEKLNFGNKDQNVKFRKLMGIKGDDDEADVSKPVNEEGLKTLQKQEEMFRNLDVQYEMARSQTHTQRGMGLGFSSSFSRGMDSI
uniref:Arginine/serine-rich coiled-coil protein 2 n=1 Tax=Tetraodon nigroviridis TaxID=99883 RepID=H3DEG6_TETNG